MKFLEGRSFSPLFFGVDRLRVVTFAMGQAHPHQVDLGTATEAPLVSVQQARP